VLHGKAVSGKAVCRVGGEDFGEHRDLVHEAIGRWMAVQRKCGRKYTEGDG
jgi:hypothetical protein